MKNINITIVKIIIPNLIYRNHNDNTFSNSGRKELKELKKLVGKSGRAVGVLNLGGRVKINGRFYEAVSVKSFIENNQHIKVVGVKDNTLLVRKWFE